MSGQVAGVTKEMSLLEFLKKANANFSCSPSDCNTTFLVSTPSSTKEAILGVENKYYGMVARNMNPLIMNMSFSVAGQSNALPECGKSPLKLDLLDDGTIDWEYKEPSFDEWCTPEVRPSHCFNEMYAVGDAVLSTTPYCQKILLNKTGRLQVAANLTIYSGSPGSPNFNDIEFLVFDANGNLVGDCSVEYFDYYEPDYEMASCFMGPEYRGEPSSFYLSEEGVYYVCVRVGYGAEAEYLIRKETQPDVCGFYGAPPSQTFTEDYAIYAHEAKFDAFNSEVVFDESMFLGQGTLMYYLQNYVNSKYNGNCNDTNGCVFPLKFISMASQTLNLSNPVLKYQPQGTGPMYENKFYDVLVSWPKINMTQQALPFAALNLTAPTTPTFYVASARVGSAFGSQGFRVEQVPQIFSLSPLVVIPGQNTSFSVVASAPGGRQITQYVWNFGDNTGDEVTSTASINHVYTQVGTYTLTVKVQDSSGLIGSRSFSITSNVTRELLNDTIKALRIRLNNFGTQYNTLDYWYRDMVGLNVSTINATLNVLESQLATATPTQLVDIKNSLDALNIPVSINDTLVLRDSPYSISTEDIEPSYVADASGESYDPNLEEQYKNAIGFWQDENVNLMISGSAKAFIYEGRVEDKLTIVNLKIDPLATVSEAYVIFLLPGLHYNDVRFLSNADETDNLGNAVAFSYSKLSGIETISVALPGKHDFSELVFYVSPSLKELEIIEEVLPTEEEKPPYALAIILIIVILAVLGIALWFVWKGAKKKEKELFKNPTDLYNITTFIRTNEAAGLPKSEIVAKLEKAGWSKEQINYAFKKIKEQGAGVSGAQGQKPIFIGAQRPQQRPTRPARRY
ncbi:MAG: PKD domain-containing protein [Candidatus Bathyarchaeota archaeon]|nr:PKD domain-containing protein [Candidatus Bathyarchaeota archaeon]